MSDLDGAVLSFLQNIRSPLLTQAMTDITALGSLSVMLVFSVVTIALLLSFKDGRGVLHFTFLVAGTIVWPRVLKQIFNRPRPDMVDPLALVSDSSFPSGHSFTAAALYLTFAFFAARHARSRGQEIFFLILSVLIVALVGFSRMYLGVHYPSDVIAGAGLGTAWSLLLAFIFIYGTDRRRKKSGRGTK